MMMRVPSGKVVRCMRGSARFPTLPRRDRTGNDAKQRVRLDRGDGAWQQAEAFGITQTQLGSQMVPFERELPAGNRQPPARAGAKHLARIEIETAHLRFHQQSQQVAVDGRSEEHTSELQSPVHLVCRLLLEKKKQQTPQ